MGGSWYGAAVGPLEVVAIQFEGERFNGEIMASLTAAIESGALRIVDLTFVSKDASGAMASYELAELDEDAAAQFDLVDMTLGLLSVTDLERIGAVLAPGSSAALIVVEHQWAAELERAVVCTNARLVAHKRIPCDVARTALSDAGVQEVHLGGPTACLDDS
jgi:Family of unknown function (DUF6325)